MKRASIKQPLYPENPTRYSVPGFGQELVQIEGSMRGLRRHFALPALPPRTGRVRPVHRFGREADYAAMLRLRMS